MRIFFKHSVLIGIAILTCFIARSYRESLPDRYSYEAIRKLPKNIALTRFALEYKRNKKLEAVCSDLENLSTPPIHDLSTHEGVLSHLKTVAWIHNLDSNAWQILIEYIPQSNGSFSGHIQNYNDRIVAMLAFHGSKRGCNSRHKKSQF